MAAALADDFSEIILRIAMLRNKLLITQGFFERIEVRALYVFHDRQFKRRAIIDITHNDRNFCKTGQLRGPPAPFASDNLILPARKGAHHDRLNDAMLANGGSKLLQLRFVKRTARVAWVANHMFDRDLAVSADTTRRSGTSHRDRLIHLANQGRKAATKAAF